MLTILSVISVCDRIGGTTVKLKKLVEESAHNHIVYFSLYDKKTIAAFSENKKWFEASGKVKAYGGFYGRNPIKYSLEIARIAKENKVDIINFYFNFENSFAPLIKILYPKVILFRSIVGYEKRLSPVREFILKNVLKPIDNVIYISNYIKNIYEKEFAILKRKHSNVIYNAAIHASNSFTNPGNRSNFVSISGLVERKNLTVIIKAMAILVYEYKIDSKLFILGDGPSRLELEQLILKLNLVNNVILVGYSNESIKYLNDCKVYLHPADTEGFGIAVTEAMYMKCPTIVSNAGALPELVDNNVTGFIAQPYEPKDWAEKMRILWLNEDMRMEMANAAHERVCEVFPLSAFVSNHDKAYDLAFQSRLI